MARAPQTPGGRFSCGSAWAGLLLLAALCVLLAVGAPRARAQMEEHIEHAFDAQTPNLAPVGIAFSVPVAQPEDVVELWTYSMGPDIDYCTAGGYYCPIYGFQDSVEIEYQALGGDLGHLDGYGQFVADVANPTHFRCGPVGPAGVRATPVDAAQVWDPVAHRLLPGWDDDTGTHPSPIGGAGITIREHQHQWMASNDLPPPTVTMQNWVQAGTRVPITVDLGTDWDWCLEDRCPLPDGRIENSLTVTGFSGGTFGYYDANGQWVVSGNRALITHWEAPGVEGNYPVTVTADDTPRGWMTHVYPPRIFSSYDDEPASTTVDVYVTLEPPHEHQWEAVSNISPPSLSLPSTVRPGERIALSLTGSGSDSDTCLAYDCPFGGTVGNLLQVTSWGGGGSCGYVDAQGQWVPSGDPALITHWRAPGTLGQVTVSAVVDDLPTATSPITGHADSTYNDDPVVIQATTQVAGTPVHSHDWQQVSDIAAPVVTVSGTPALGAVLGLSVSTSPDSDRCVAAACTFPGSTAANPVNVTAWSDGGAGGIFGYLEGGSTFQPSGDPALITHYKLRADDPGVDVSVRLTATVDDQYQGITDPGAPDPISTYNDTSTTGSYSVVLHTTTHTHQWDTNGNKAWQTTTLYRNGVATRTVYRGEILEVRLGDIHPDWDLCTAAGCPFPNGRADEITAGHRTVKLDNDIGGSYGMLVGGQFTPLPPTNVANITHFLVPYQTTASVLHAFSHIDDAGEAYAAPGLPSPTQNDAPAPAAFGTEGFICLTIADSGVIGGRLTSGDDACGCPACNSVPALSSIDPHSGAVSFDVPVTGWTYKGTDLGLSLHYASDSRADPRLEGRGVSVNGDRAALSSGNSRWTHTWAQFMEVVSDGAEVRALWHTGDGGAVGFLGIWNPVTKQYDWDPTDSVHSLQSAGTASTYLDAEVTEPGGNAIVPTKIRIDVPYGEFTLTDGAGTQYFFDQVYWEKGDNAAVPHFLLKLVRDRWGRTVSVAWTSDGKPLHVVDGAGNGLDFNYTAGLLTSVTDPWNKTHQLAYTDVPSGPQLPNLPPPPAYKKLTQVVVRGPGSPNRVDYTWGFGYGTEADGQGTGGGAYGGTFTGDLVIHKTEPGGKQVHYAYEGNPGGHGTFTGWDGRVKKAWYYDGSEGREKAYFRNGGQLTFPGGDQTTYTFLGHDLTTVHDNTRNREVGYTYDSYHNLTGVTLNGVSQGTIAYTYGPDNRTIVKARATNALGDATETEFISFGRPVKYTAFHRTGGGQPYDLKTQWLYHNTGPGDLFSATVFTSPRTYTTRFTYGDVVPSGAPHTAGAAAPPGVPKTVTDPLGRVYTSDFDALGRPIRAFSPPNLLPLANDPAPSVGSVQYGPDGAPWRVTDPLGRVSEVTYNGLGGGLLEITSHLVGVADTTSKTIVNAAGNVVQVIDPRGVETTCTYNGDGQVLTVEQASGTADARVTQYRYDTHGNLSELVPPKGEDHTIRFDYTRFNTSGYEVQPVVYEGQVTRIRHPEWNGASALGQELFGYDAATGLMTWSSRPASVNGVTYFPQIQYQYDALHRPYRTIYPSSLQGVAGFTVETNYDEFGRVSSVTDSEGTTTYRYDAANRPTEITPSGGRRKLTFQYYEDPYPLQRRRTAMTLYGVGTWEYREDTKGRFSGVVNPFQQAFSYEYDAAGQPVAQYNANGTSSTFQYNSRGLLSGLTHRNAFGAAMDALSYQHDAAGRITSELDLGGRQHGFEYDNLGQLTRETHPDFTQTVYEYDPNGNRTRVVRNGVSEYYGVNASDQLLWVNRANRAPLTTDADATLFQYDAFGQMLRREKRATGATTTVHTFHWDADGRLRKAFLGNTQFFSAAYGADGRRIKKNDGLSSHLDSFGLYDEITGGGRQPITYTPGFSLREAVAGASTGTDRYFHQDWLGTTRYLTEAGGGLDRAGGALVPYAKRHDAYGLQTAYAGIDDPNGLAPQYAGATGYLRDSSLGLDYLHHRYYDPAIGRFITRDPIGWAGGLNLYGYVGNDPVNAVDPSGLSPWDDFKGGAKAAGVWLLQAPGHLGMAIWKGISPLWAVKIDYGVQPGLRGANAETPGGYALATRGAELSDGIDEMAGGVILPAVGAGLVSIAAARSGPCTSSRPFGRFSMRGRLGSVKTRTQLRAIANELESRGWRVTNGGSRIPHVKEEFIPRGPGRPTGTWVDLTATKNGRILRVQTVDTLVGGQPTLDEALAIGRIRGFQRPGDHLLVVPKVK